MGPGHMSSIRSLLLTLILTKKTPITNLDVSNDRQERNAKAGREDPGGTTNHELPADGDSGSRSWQSGLGRTLGARCDALVSH